METTTEQLHKLSLVNETQRDGKWERTVLQILPHAGVRVVHAAPQNGPDGWPYLYCETAADAEPEPIAQILEWLFDKGIGLALNPQKSAPDFVLSYGMIWNFKETGAFLGEREVVADTTLKIEEGTKVQHGAPAEAYLPVYVRVILRQFLAEQGVYQPRVLVMTTDLKNYDLCFSLESFGNPPEKEHHGVLEALAWFLPAHYSLVLISESGLPAFTAL